MTPNARMLGGSTGKSFVAALALNLHSDGRFDLDAPLARWLGDRDWFGRVPNAPDLTPRLLLRHQSGLPDHIRMKACQAAMRQKMEAEGPDAALSAEEVDHFILDAQPLFPAGDGYHYSDTNYILVGLAIEEATGCTYYSLLADRFLAPLELDDTTPADRRTLPALAAGYIEGENAFSLPTKVADDGVLAYNPATEWTGGGLVTTSRDLARWAKALYEERAFPAPYLSALLDAVPKDSTQRARFGDVVRYGLGVTIRSTEHGPAYGHRGWTPGYLSIFEYYPEHQIAVAMQINAQGPYAMTEYATSLASVGRKMVGR